MARIQRLYPLLSLTPISTHRSANPAKDRGQELHRNKRWPRSETLWPGRPLSIQETE